MLYSFWFVTVAHHGVGEAVCWYPTIQEVSTSHEAKTEEHGAAQVVKLLKLVHGSSEATLVAPLSYSKLPEAELSNNPLL